MKTNINFTETELNTVKTLFLKGLEKQLQDYLNEINILENYSPEPKYISSFIEYLEELSEVANAYEFKRIFTLSKLVVELLKKIKEQEIFSNNELKETIENIIKDIINIKISDEEINEERMKKYEEKKEELLRKNKILKLSKLDLSNLKFDFKYEDYENIISDYKRILIYLNRLTYQLTDIKKIKSKSGDKELLEKFNNNFSAITQQLLSLQEKIQLIYFQQIKELYQIIESILSKNGIKINILDYDTNTKINPEAFLILYNELPLFLEEISKIDKNIRIEIMSDEFNNIIKIIFTIYCEQKNQHDFINLINTFFNEKIKLEYLNYRLESDEKKIQLILEFQNIIYYF
ncbi:MAG TPA: hypothetical protein PLD27_07055 [bacterium]|nr:hypothetical protein [bacterium]HOL47008.1 hypothetical protein [bacterium]HPQ18996.1 hypothetical protein [bacterium]